RGRTGPALRRYRGAALQERRLARLDASPSFSDLGEEGRLPLPDRRARRGGDLPADDPRTRAALPGHPGHRRRGGADLRTGWLPDGRLLPRPARVVGRPLRRGAPGGGLPAVPPGRATPSDSALRGGVAPRDRVDCLPEDPRA